MEAVKDFDKSKFMMILDDGMMDRRIKKFQQESIRNFEKEQPLTKRFAAMLARPANPHLL